MPVVSASAQEANLNNASSNLHVLSFTPCERPDMMYQLCPEARSSRVSNGGGASEMEGDVGYCFIILVDLKNGECPWHELHFL